ncbi:TetR/AcrR family transcriptional regulator [Arenimonas daejeonensis]|uniref:TetR/AcrR family transcriptional regulator n=1 Tax=Arenimonas daejeonensis TaxID=370777 RepID=UPI001315A186|nr:TetR/AcrR family transcriptional regulator [Arenimonas daejeonensis]
MHDHRETLIDAAREQFAAHGFAATSLRQIALAAKVTPALTHYYFKDKAGLLDAVVEDRVAPLAQGLGVAVKAAGPDPVAALRAFVHAYTTTASKNPWLPRLIVREVLSDGGALRTTFPERFAGGMAAMLRGVVQAGQERGDFRADLDPSEVAMSVLSLCIFPFLAAPLVNMALGIDTSPKHADALISHHLAVLMAGIAKSP